MNKLSRTLIFFVYSGILCSFTMFAFAASEGVMTCKANGSDDYFIVYAEQLTYSSNQFSHYQLIDGLTIIVINKDTLRFNRLSNLNLLPSSTIDPQQPPEPYQFFEGQCLINS